MLYALDLKFRCIQISCLGIQNMLHTSINIFVSTPLISLRSIYYLSAAEYLFYHSLYFNFIIAILSFPAKTTLFPSIH